MEINFREMFDDTVARDTCNVSNICKIPNKHLIDKQDIKKERYAYFGRIFGINRKLLF
jgi:hypothetical protein